MRIAARHAVCGLVVVDCHVNGVAVGTERRQPGVVGIRRDDAHLAVHGRFGHLAGFSLVRIDDTHRQAQFERIGELAPLLGAAAVDIVGFCGNSIRAVLGKHLDRGIQLFEKLVVNLLLRIVRHLNLAVLADHRIGDRAVGVGHTVHGGHLDDVGDRQYDGVVGHLLQLAQVRVKHRDRPVAIHENVRPVVRRIVIHDRTGKATRRGIIPTHGAAQQHIGKLRRIDVGRYDGARERGQRRADDIAVGLHVVLGGLVRIGIYIEVVGGAGRTDKYQRSQSRF